MDSPNLDTSPPDSMDHLDMQLAGSEDMEGVVVAEHSEEQVNQQAYNEDHNIGDPVDCPVPPYLKDISSLASWTVSSHKPGCGVAALRHPSTNSFWQSDGPQPHILNIHFFKLVLIAHIRIYLDHSLDESYTPTRMLFRAGTSHHDLQFVCEMKTDAPKGWLAVDLSNAGGPPVLEPGEDSDDDLDDPEDVANDDEETRLERARQRVARRRIARGSTLRAFLVQLQILENHQNGKDTHLRGLQIFAKDEAYTRRAKKRRRVTGSPVREENAAEAEALAGAAEGKKKRKPRDNLADIADGLVGLREPDWMGEPELR